MQKDVLLFLKEKEPNLPKVFTGDNNDENKALVEFSAAGLLKRLNINNFSAENKNLIRL